MKEKEDKDKKPDGFRIIVDQKQHLWPTQFITGLQIKELAGVDASTFDAWQDVPGPEDELVGDGTKIDLSEHGVEKFFTGKKTTTEG